MVATISREELKKKLDNNDDFILVETFPKETFDHAHLPKAVNLPPDQVAELAGKIKRKKAGAR